MIPYFDTKMISRRLPEARQDLTPEDTQNALERIFGRIKVEKKGNRYTYRLNFFMRNDLLADLVRSNSKVKSDVDNLLKSLPISTFKQPSIFTKIKLLENVSVWKGLPRIIQELLPRNVMFESPDPNPFTDFILYYYLTEEWAFHSNIYNEYKKSSLVTVKIETSEEMTDDNYKRLLQYSDKDYNYTYFRFFERA